MNKKWFRLWNVGRLRTRLMHMLALGRTLVLLGAGSFVFFVLLGAGGLAGQKLNPSPLPSMQGLASSLPRGLFTELLGMELPHLPEPPETAELSPGKVTSFVFQLLTSVNPDDPKSLLSREVPGMAAGNPVLLRSGSGGDEGAPADYHPGTDGGGAEDGTETAEGDGQLPPQADSPDEGGAPEPPVVTPAPSPAAGGQESASSQKPDGGGTGEESVTAETAVKRILIYHSHPREAYNPLLSNPSDNPSSADPNKNVMLVGSYIADRLEKKGIGVIHSKEDYATEEAGYNWNFSYKYSRVTVKAAMAGNSELDGLIDIHRDSQRHGRTTTVINGKSYAQVYFILGHENKDWKKNEAFANEIHKRLEKTYPGISRGIWGKTSNQGNGEYNQSLSPNSVLIEIGGIDSTAEELKATSDILGDIIADVYWSRQDAEKADAPAAQTGKAETKSGKEGAGSGAEKAD